MNVGKFRNIAKFEYVTTAGINKDAILNIESVNNCNRNHQKVTDCERENHR